MREEDSRTWELAKAELDRMPEPQLYNSQYLLPIQGYECSLNIIKDSPKKQVTIWNDKYRTSYTKDFDGLGEYRQVKSTFSK